MQAVRSCGSPGVRRARAGLVAFVSALAGAAAFLPADAAAQAENLFTTIGITESDTRQNSEINGNPTPYSLPADEMPPSRTVGVPEGDPDDIPLRMPDTSGTLPNLAAFQGQLLTLREEDRKAYSRIHFFGTTTDGGPAGGDFVLTYDDGTTQSIQVRFRDWCASRDDTPAHHIAIGRMTKRYRTVGQDTAQCSIYHVPADVQAGKTLVSVRFPATTTPGNPPIQAYLMALTLEQPDGAFELPDLAGRVEFPDDELAPTTTHSVEPAAPDGADGWYVTPARVTLDATDEGEAGVEQTIYRIGAAPPRAYSGPFTVGVDGDHTLTYRSIDAAGNAETSKSFALKVDANAPDTTATVSPEEPLGAGGWHDGAITVRLDARDDPGSGVAGTSYRLDGEDWQPYGGAIVVEQAGDRALEFRSRDVAGNEEPIRSVRVKIDKTPPVTSALVNGAPPQAQYAGAARIALVRDDGDGSGAAATEFRIGGGAWTPYAGSFDLTELGGYRVDFRSRDVVGNVENFRTLLLTLVAPPVATGRPPGVPDVPAARPFVALEPVARHRATVAALRRGRLAVRVTCQGVERSSVTLAVSRATARALGLKRRILARRSVRCGDEGRGTVTLVPGRAIKRALARHRGAIAATVTLTARGAATDRATVVLRGRGRR